jgi:hypothetical protein
MSIHKSANIKEGDILVVDRSIEATHGKIVVAVINNDFTVKTLYNKDGIVKLIPANPDFPEITFQKGQKFTRTKGVKMFALVDCNNFYVSCERVFCPELKEKAVVVLSNQDRVVISCSNDYVELKFSLKCLRI